MRIGSSMAGLIARNNYARAQATIDRSMERMATGRRINRASDDPAGLIAAEQLASRRATIEETMKAREMAGYALNAAEGALSEIDSMLVELNSLVVSAANTGGTSATEREALQIEANAIISGIGHIVNTTTFKGQKILSTGTAVEYGGNSRWISAIDLRSLGLTSHTKVDENGDENVLSYSLADLLGSGRLNFLDGDLELAQRVAESAGAAITAMRASLGATSKYSIDSEVRALAVEHENTVAAESLIRDADMALEVSAYARAEVLRQASLISMELAQKQAWQVLSLLA
jgi:flagellin